MFFVFLIVSEGRFFGMSVNPFPEEISDYLAHGPIIRVLTISAPIVVKP